MRVFPRHELRPKYLGERTVFDLLSKVDLPQGFAVHSMNLPDHQYKRWGEADFVVVGPTGVTVLEVKGGVVTLAGREWRYENARGQAIISTEGPARQALSAAIALEELLSERLGKSIRCRWGVTFPLCSFNVDIAELPRRRLADIHTCQDAAAFAAWLRDIPFDRLPVEANALSSADLEALHDIIVPELCAVPSLGLAVRANENEVVRLTQQQFRILESLDSNPRLCVTGGAGTGKTELAVLCARAERAAGRRPAIVTSAGMLLDSLASRMAPNEIPVVTGALPVGVDTLIVDEGQDLAQPKAMAELFRQLPGGVTEGRWRWFMDPNLQFLETPPDPECLRLLSESSAPVTLTRNVRSTREIVSVIRALLDADVGVSEIDGFGVRVGVHRASDPREEIAFVSALVNNALEDGLNPTDIAVLGPAGVGGPVCRGVGSALSDVLRPVVSGGSIQSGAFGIVGATKSFRGMEAGMVILVDLDLLPPGDRGLSHLYIGMSRARASLQLMLEPAGFSRLQQRLTQPA